MLYITVNFTNYIRLFKNNLNFFSLLYAKMLFADSTI